MEKVDSGIGLKLEVVVRDKDFSGEQQKLSVTKRKHRREVKEMKQKAHESQHCRNRTGNKWAM